MRTQRTATVLSFAIAALSLGAISLLPAPSYAQSDEQRDALAAAVRACTAPDTPARQRVLACDFVLTLDDLDGERRAALLAYRAAGKSELFDYSGTIEDFTEALSLMPDNPGFLRGRARAQGFLGNLEEAIIDLDEALAISPVAAPLLVDRAIAHAEMGNEDAALRDLDAAESETPSYSDIYNIRAGILTDREEYKEAEAQFTKAIDLSPSFGPLYSRRGFVRLLDDRPQEAIGDFDIAVGLDVTRPETFFYRGVAQNMLEDLDEAIADFSRAIDLDPTLASAWHRRGIIHMEESVYPEAIEDLDVAAQLSPSADYLNTLAWVLVSAKDESFRDAERGLDIVNRSLALDENADNTDTAAAAYVLLGDAETALSFYQKAMDLGGEDRVVMYQEYLSETGHYKGAIDGLNGPATEAAIRAFSEDGRVLLVD